MKPSADGGPMIARWPHGDPREVARAILADRRYVLAQPVARGPSWFDAAREWLGKLLRPLLHVVDHALGRNSPFEVAIGATVIVAACAVFAFAVFGLVRSFADRPRPPRRAAASTGAFGVAGVQSAAALRGAALEAARAGRYREATALLFAAAARALDETGRLAYDAARTPGEYRRLVRDPLFDALTADAVVALFAATEPRHDVFDRMSAVYDRLFDDVRAK